MIWGHFPRTFELIAKAGGQHTSGHGHIGRENHHHKVRKFGSKPLRGQHPPKLAGMLTFHVSISSPSIQHTFLQVPSRPWIVVMALIETPAGQLFSRVCTTSQTQSPRPVSKKSNLEGDARASVALGPRDAAARVKPEEKDSHARSSSADHHGSFDSSDVHSRVHHNNAATSLQAIPLMMLMLHRLKCGASINAEPGPVARCKGPTCIYGERCE